MYIYINGKSPANQLNDKYFVDYQRLTMITGEKTRTPNRLMFMLRTQSHRS